MTQTRRTILHLFFLSLFTLSPSVSFGVPCRRVLGVGNHIYTIGQCLRNAATALAATGFPNLIVDNGLVKANVGGREGDLQIDKDTGALTGAVNPQVIKDLVRYYNTFGKLFTGPSKGLVDLFLRWANSKLASGNNVGAAGGTPNAQTHAAQGTGNGGSGSARGLAVGVPAGDTALNCNDINGSTCTQDLNRQNVALKNQDKQREILNDFNNSKFGQAAKQGNVRGNLVAYLRNVLPPMDDIFKEAKTFVKAGLALDNSLDAETVRQLSEEIDSKVTLLYLPKNLTETAIYFRDCGAGFTDNAMFNDRTDRVTLCWGRILSAIAVCGARQSPIKNCLMRTLMHEIGHFVEKFLQARAKDRNGRVVNNAAVNKFMDCYYDNFSKKNLSLADFRSSAAMGENLADYVAGLGYKAKFAAERTDARTNASETKEGFANICGIPSADDHPSTVFRLEVNSTRVFAPEIGCVQPKYCSFSGVRT